MISEPANSILVIIICIVGALHFGGILATSTKSPTLTWIKAKHPYFPKILVIMLGLVAVTKVVGLLFKHAGLGL